MDLNRVLLFIRIVEAGNISKAARNLNLPKNKLSRNLALLEEELGIQLVYRTTRQFKLTEAGVEFYQNSKSHMDGLIEAAASLKDDVETISGTIRITAPDDIGIHVITKVVNEFSLLHPLVTFELFYSNEILDLVKLGIDVAFRTGKLKDSTLIQKKAADIDFIIAASPKYLSKYRPIMTVEDLASHRTIGFMSRDRNQWKLSSRDKVKTVKLHHQILLNNFAAMLEFVLAGQGIGLLPKFLCQTHLTSGEMVQVLKSWGDEGAPLHIAVPPQKKMPARVRAFLDFAGNRVKDYF